MSRFGSGGIEDLLPVGTPRTRAVALFGGLAILALLNYLDLVGVLGLGWTNDGVGWIATSWTIFVGSLIESRDELKKRVTQIGALVLVVLGLVGFGGLTSPNLGETYWYHETVLGQLTWAVAPSVGNAAVVLTGMYLLVVGAEWLSEYWHLRRTTPEERVLKEDR